ncbi:MAG: hypothetical protein V8Q84_11550 [Bilophila sp.]
MATGNTPAGRRNGRPLPGTDGERTDYNAAHLFGLLSGFGVGGVAGWLLRRTGEPSRAIKSASDCSSGAILWLCWRAAL